MKIKKNIKYSKERVVISDTLPYETPITFSNRHFYNFLNDFKIEYLSGSVEKIVWNENLHPRVQKVVQEFIRILFDVNNLSVDSSIILDKKELRKIPFAYKITHKEKDFRELSIPHPKNQLELVAFYDKYKEVILYYCQISSFSIRRPFSIAKYIFSNDKLHKKNIGDSFDAVEDSEKEYENLKTFFTYRKFSNIYKFYEDYQYHRSEKKYNKMFKFDIAKCFDSIYTHSISWALLNKDIVKDNVGFSYYTFSGEFDTFMSNSNYGETNGILIGPEYSRIFSELILQQVDRSIEVELKKDCKLVYKVDYEIYRYVDDFFVFYNNDETKELILSRYKHKLKEYKMSVSESKTVNYDKPLITELTIAKEKIVELFESKIKFKFLEKEGSSIKDLKFKCNSNHLITKFKIIVKESNVEYKNIMNYTLAILGKRVTRILKKFEAYYSVLVKLNFEGELDEDQRQKMKRQEKLLTSFVNEILDFTFFLYTVSPRVNSTIKLSHILIEILKFYQLTYKLKTPGMVKYQRCVCFDESNQELIFKKVYDEINLILLNNKVQKHIQIESLYLYIILGELGKNYRIGANQLIQYFKLIEGPNKAFQFEFEPNYFTITVLLFYIRNIREYDAIKQVIKNAIILKIESVDEDKRRKTTELVLLFFDLLVCPYLDNNFKRKIMTLFNINDLDLQSEILMFKKHRKYWFTKWDSFNLSKELLAKKSLEVY